MKKLFALAVLFVLIFVFVFPFALSDVIKEPSDAPVQPVLEKDVSYDINYSDPAYVAAQEAAYLNEKELQKAAEEKAFLIGGISAIIFLGAGLFIISHLHKENEARKK